MRCSRVTGRGVYVGTGGFILQRLQRRIGHARASEVPAAVGEPRAAKVCRHIGRVGCDCHRRGEADLLPPQGRPASKCGLPQQRPTNAVEQTDLGSAWGHSAVVPDARDVAAQAALKLHTDGQ